MGYSVVLIADRGNDDWGTVRVYDNRHGQHDMHRHTFSGDKRGAEEFHHGTPKEAQEAALNEVKSSWEEMIAGWRATR